MSTYVAGTNAYVPAFIMTLTNLNQQFQTRMNQWPIDFIHSYRTVFTLSLSLYLTYFTIIF